MTTFPLSDPMPVPNDPNFDRAISLAIEAGIKLRQAWRLALLRCETTDQALEHHTKVLEEFCRAMGDAMFSRPSYGDPVHLEARFSLLFEGCGRCGHKLVSGYGSRCSNPSCGKRT